ncbi:hypothetical protein B0T25DRAFT_586492 [Lasiosphaeria hispida]|uniref:Uncharacterized protein n=1 Tax=Lasiosphaeria hispida TaxID=260671 RepID=A0AAJ0H5K7_9PEZI|nr:hypothetical protein B0T25DRAFT_586492 [Lasiosphaeria hispida]
MQHRLDGYISPGDKIAVRVGDRRRVQTFVEDEFLIMWYIDPVGTSRFAPIKPDIAIPIIAGKPIRVKVLTPRVAIQRAEDVLKNIVNIRIDMAIGKVRGAKSEAVQLFTNTEARLHQATGVKHGQGGGTVNQATTTASPA